MSSNSDLIIRRSSTFVGDKSFEFPKSLLKNRSFWNVAPVCMELICFALISSLEGTSESKCIRRLLNPATEWKNVLNASNVKAQVKDHELNHAYYSGDWELLELVFSEVLFYIDSFLLSISKIYFHVL